MEDKPDEKPMKKIPKKEQMSVPKILKVKDLRRWTIRWYSRKSS